MLSDIPPWMIWVGLALVLVALEALTVDFFFVMLGGGALGGAIAAGLGADVWLQVVVAAATAIALLLTVRPWLKQRFGGGVAPTMGAGANIGRSAFALDRVTSSSGQVKLAGETWSARTTGESIEPGEEVVVESIDGATAIVSRAHTRHLETP